MQVVDTEGRGGGRSTDSRGALVIDEVRMDDEGLYYCSAYSPLDDLRTDYPIWVSVKGQSLSTRSYSLTVKGKCKVFPYSFPCVGHGADPGVQAVTRQVTLSHPPGGRLPLLSASLRLPSRLQGRI